MFYLGYPQRKKKPQKEKKNRNPELINCVSSFDLYTSDPGVHFGSRFMLKENIRSLFFPLLLHDWMRAEGYILTYLLFVTNTDKRHEWSVWLQQDENLFRIIWVHHQKEERALSLFKAIKKKKKIEIYAHKHTSVHTLCPGLMTFREQPTILFVSLECRYVTAASAAALQLQPDARATELPQWESKRGDERREIELWGKGIKKKKKSGRPFSSCWKDKS